MKTKTYEITMRFGSDHQEEIGVSQMQAILAATKFYMENAHKKNMFEIKES